MTDVNWEACHKTVEDISYSLVQNERVDGNPEVAKQREVERKTLTALFLGLKRDSAADDLESLIEVQQIVFKHQLAGAEDKPDRRARLQAALTDMTTLHRSVQLLRQPGIYLEAVERLHQAPKHRSGGLPRDMGRRAILSLLTHFRNSAAEATGPIEELDLIDSRAGAMKTTERLYIQLQRQVLATEQPANPNGGA